VNRRTYITGVCSAAVAGLAGCSSGSEGGNGDSDQLIEIKNDELETGEEGFAVIKGEAENVAGEQVAGAVISAKLYDQDGNNLNEADEVDSPDPLGTVGEDGVISAGETQEFEIPTGYSVEDIDEYELSLAEEAETMSA